jgi:hypothetical protein
VFKEFVYFVVRPSPNFCTVDMAIKAKGDKEEQSCMERA